MLFSSKIRLSDVIVDNSHKVTIKYVNRLCIMVLVETSNKYFNDGPIDFRGDHRNRWRITKRLDLLT